MFQSLKQDLIYAARSFVKSPGLTCVIVLSIGLGIAANTTVFSLTNELLLKDLPVREPGTLFALNHDRNYSFSYPEFIDYRDGTTGVFQGLAAHCPLAPANLNAGGAPLRSWGQLVSGNYFPLLGVPTILGRGIQPYDDEAKGKGQVVVLGHGLWRRLGSDPGIIGRSIILSGAPYTVVGVAAPGFFGTDRGLAPEFWAPLSMRTHLLPEVSKDAETSRTSHWIELTGRLLPGVSREQAQAAAAVVNERIWQQFDQAKQPGKKARPIMLSPAGRVPDIGNFLKLLMTALMVVVGLVLLIACANVANLLLARAASRQHEIGVRLAMGASRGRLIRQLLTESVLLSGLGAAFGFLLAVPGTAALSRFQPPLPIPIRFDFTPDGRVLLFTTVLAVVTGIVFGLAPALAGTRGNLVGAIRQTGFGGGGFRRGWLAGTLVTVQVTLSLVLLIGSGLFLRSLQHAASIDIGMKPEGLMMLALDPKSQGYSPEKAKEFFRRLDERVTALPGVQSMSFVNIPPLSMASAGGDYTDATAADGKRVNANSFNVGRRYFETTGIKLVRGRDFDGRDEKASTAIVNLALAKRLFGDQDPIGRQIRSGHDKKVFEIVGLVANAKAERISEEEVACVFQYLPADFNQAITFIGVTVMVRTSGDPGRMLRAITTQAEALDRNMAVFGVETMTHHVEEALMLPRVCAILFGGFGGLGLVLAVVGLYGVVNFSVRTRTREIGIRMALGARSVSIGRMVALQGLRLVGIGLVIGLGLAYAGSRAMAALLYGIRPTDPVTFVAVPLLLVGVSVIAILVPAHRASRIAPLSALRYE